MTEAQLKQFLHDFDTIQNKLLFQKNYHDTYSNSISKHSCSSDEFKLMLITDAIKHLTPEEAFIIEIHLKAHHTWTETAELFSQKSSVYTLNIKLTNPLSHCIMLLNHIRK